MREIGAQVVAGVLSGKLHPRVASDLAPLLNMQLRAIHMADLQRRRKRLEQKLADPSQDSEDLQDGTSTTSREEDDDDPTQ